MSIACLCLLVPHIENTAANVGSQNMWDGAGKHDILILKKTVGRNLANVVESREARKQTAAEADSIMAWLQISPN